MLPLVLAAGLMLSPSFYAQTAPAPDIALPAGDAARGKAIFESSKGNCLSCHRVNGVGSLFAPELSAIGAPRGGGGGGGRGGGGGGGGGAAAGAPRGGAAAGANTPPAAGGAARGGAGPGGGAAPAGGARGALPAFGGDEAANAAIAGRGGAGRGGGQGGQGNAAAGPNPQQLAQSILDPNAVVNAANRYVILKMKDGKTITGKLLSIDTFAMQIFTSEEKLANISKDNVRETTMASPMPSYRDKLTTQELSDVISYLMSLKGQ